MVKDFGDHRCRQRMFPGARRRGINPPGARPGENRALEPYSSGLRIEMLDRAAGGHDLVRAHRGVADEDDAIIALVGIDEIAGRRALVVPNAIVLPHPLVEAVVEVEMVEPLELAFCRGEELVSRLHVPIHRAADVEKQERLDGVAALGPHEDVDIAFVGSRADRAVEIELFGHALAGESPEPPQRQLDVARSELRVAVEVLELPPVPDLDGAAPAAFVLADAHAFGLVAIGAERRRSAGADPFRAALMAPLLLGEALAQRLHQLVEAELLDLSPLLGTKISLHHSAQPFLRQVSGPDRSGDAQNALEGGGEDDVELVEIALVLD